MSVVTHTSGPDFTPYPVQDVIFPLLAKTHSLDDSQKAQAIHRCIEIIGSDWSTEKIVDKCVDILRENDLMSMNVSGHEMFWIMENFKNSSDLRNERLNSRVKALAHIFSINKALKELRACGVGESDLHLSFYLNDFGNSLASLIVQSGEKIRLEYNLLSSSVTSMNVELPILQAISILREAVTGYNAFIRSNGNFLHLVVSFKADQAVLLENDAEIIDFLKEVNS